MRVARGRIARFSVNSSVVTAGGPKFFRWSCTLQAMCAGRVHCSASGRGEITQLVWATGDPLYMTKQTVFGVVLFSMGSFGCSGGEEEVAPAAHVSGKTSQESVLSVCEGRYTCAAPSADPIATTLSQSTDGCYAGALHLVEDGSIHLSDGSSGTWNGTASEFRICVEAGCLVCVPEGDSLSAGSSASSSASPSSPPPPEPEPQCVGSPWSCSTFSGGACVQEGCSFQFEVQSDGSLEPECIGSASPCSDFDSEGSCTLQKGCRWE